MISEEIAFKWYEALPLDQRLKIALFSDFGEEAKELYNWLNEDESEKPRVFNTLEPLHDGVFYIYEDGTTERFEPLENNAPVKKVIRIGVRMGEHALAVNLHDLPEQPLTNQEDSGNYDGYITKYDDAVADWSGRSNTDHIKSIGTGIELKDDEWIPSVAELYLIYLNKRSINAAIELSGGSRIKDGWYWTSTETSATTAWLLGLYDGDLIDWYTKVSTSNYVRPVAAFH